MSRAPRSTRPMLLDAEAKWWQAFGIWLGGSEISLLVIPITGNVIRANSKLRKGLRDARDRAARRDDRWRAVAMAGLTDCNRTTVLIRHVGIARSMVELVLRRRWPDAVLCDMVETTPTFEIGSDVAADLGRRRRGIEPATLLDEQADRDRPSKNSNSDRDPLYGRRVIAAFSADEEICWYCTMVEG